MLLGNIKQLTYSLGDTVILDKLSAELPKGACIAVVGANGAGKSTLLSLLAEELIPTSGSIDWIGNKPSVTYFKQEQMEEGDIDWNRTETAIYRSKWHVPEHAEYAFASGGERMKMWLAKALSEGSELVLLDEPTNHLDRESLNELVKVINDCKSTYLIVSHDRHFIDRTADLVFEIERGNLTVYAGNYSVYREKKEMDREIQAAHYVQQQRKITQVKEQISLLENWSAKAHAAKGGDKVYSRMKAKKRNIQIRSKRTRLEAELEKERIEKPEDEISVEFDIKGKNKKGHRVLELKDVRKKFGDNEIFSDVSFIVQAGDRIGLVGSNGSGKSTLFKMIMKEENYDGELWVTNGMSIGYMGQDELDLPNDMLVADYFQADTFEEQGNIRIQLANLGIGKKHWELSLGELSQGERVKVKLMEFIRTGMNVLLLDEPTNHLDLSSREEMEKTLATFPGTILFASHDKYFTERIATNVLVFKDKRVSKLPMTLNEWEEQIRTPKQSTPVMHDEQLRIETELQAVLGQLSMLKIEDPKYVKLDKEFNKLNKILKELKK